MATIDERVVEMRFDNKDFEKNVQTSLDTIEKLKKHLDFKDAGKSLEDLQDAAKHFSLDDIGNALEDLSSKFSWENVFKVDLLRRALDIVQGEITRVFSTVNRALMLDQVDWVNNMSLGWDKFGEKTQSVATIMAATGEDLETVNSQMEKLMFYTDETSYKFTDMANNIGKFTANGVSLDQAVSAMEGIGNWAARSGQEADAASRVMYNLSQAIGMGALKLQDWKSVELANMGTKEFKEVAIQAGLASGTLTKLGEKIVVTAKTAQEVTTSNFRETLASGWMDTDTLISTLNEYGKASELISQINEATGMWTMDMKPIIQEFRDGKMTLQSFEQELGVTGDQAKALYEAFELLSSKEYEFSLETYYAGQEARTFSQAMKSASDAVSSGWMTTFELIFGQYEEAKELWSDLAENLFSIFREPINDRNDILRAANTTGWDNLTGAIQEAGVSMDDFNRAILEASGLTRSGYDLQEIVREYGSVTDAVMQGAFGVDEGIDIVKRAIDSLQTTSAGTEGLQEVGNALGLTYEELEAYGEQVRSGMYGWYTSEEQVQRIMAANANLTEEQAKMIVKYAEAQHEVHRGLTEDEYKQWLTLNEIEETYKDILGTEVEVSELTEEQKEALKAYADQMYRRSARKSFLEGLINTGHIAVDVIGLVREAISDMFPPTTAEQLANMAQRFSDVTTSIRGFFEDTIEDENGNEVLKHAEAIDKIKQAIYLLLMPLRLVADVAAGLFRLSGPAFKLITSIISPIAQLASGIASLLFGFGEGERQLDPFASTINKVVDALSTLLGIAAEVAKHVGGFVKDKLLEKLSGPLIKIREAFQAFKGEKAKGFNEWIESLKSLDAKAIGDKIIGKLSKLWGILRNIKNGGFEFLGNIFAPVTTALGKFTTKFKKIKNETLALTKHFGGNISEWKAGLIAFRIVANEAFEKLKDKIFGTSETGLKLRGIFESVTKSISGFFSGLKNGGITKFFTDIGSKLKEFKRNVDIVSGALGISKLSAAFMLLKAKAAQALENLKNKLFGTSAAGQALREKFDAIIETVTKLKDQVVAKFKEIKDAVVGVFSGEDASEKSFLDKVKEIKDKILNIFKVEGGEEGEGGFLSNLFGENGIDFSKILKGGAIVAGIAALTKFAFGIKGVKDAAEGEEGFSLSGVIDSLNPFSDTMEKIKTAMSGFNIIGFALSMIILAGALNIMSKIPAESLGLSLGTMGLALAEFIGTLAAVNKVMGEKKIFNFIGLGLGMMAIAGALFIFAKAVEVFKEIDFASPTQALKTIVLITLAITALGSLAKKAGKFNFKLSNGLGLMATAGALWLFGKVMEYYAKLKIDRSNIMKVLGGLLLAVVTMGILAAIIGKFKFKLTNGLAMIAMATSLLIFAGVIAILGNMKDSTLSRGMKNLVMLAGIVTVMTMLIGVIMGGTRLGTGVATVLVLAGITIALTTLAAVVALLGLVPGNALANGMKTMVKLAIVVGILTAFTAIIGSAVGLKKAISSFIILGGIVVAMVAFGALLGALGILSPFIAVGLVTMGLMLAELVGIIYIMKKLADVSNMKNVFLGILAIGAFGLALIPVVYVLKQLGELDVNKVSEGLVPLIKMFVGFGILMGIAAAVGMLAATFGPIFYVGMGVVAVFFAGFIIAIHQAVTELERLAALDTDGLKGAIKGIDALINEFITIAQKFNDNGITFETAITTAAKMFAFGVGLEPLVDDISVLGSANILNAMLGIKAVDMLIDYMISLRDKFESTGTTWEVAAATSAKVYAFGVALHPLANDVKILGLSNASAATEAIKPMKELIEMMVGLKTLFLVSGIGFGKALELAGTVAAFGFGLLPLAGATFVTGFSNAETVKSNMETIKSLIDKFIEVATKLTSGEVSYEAAEQSAGLVKSFGTALLPLVGTEFLAGFVNAGNASAAFENVKSIIDFFMDSAKEFTTENGGVDEAMITAAETLAKTCKTFGIALAFIVGAEFISTFVNAENASSAFENVKSIINFFMDTAKVFVKDNGDVDDSMVTAAKETATVCKDFGEALLLIIGSEFIGQFVDAGAAEASLENAKSAINFFMETAKQFDGGEDGVSFGAAEKAVDACEGFATALIKLSIAEIVSTFADAQAASESLTVIQSMITTLINTAKEFQGDDAGESMFTSAEKASEACVTFAKSIVKLAKTENKVGKTDAEDAKEGLTAIEAMVDLLLKIAREFTQNAGMADNADRASGVMSKFSGNLSSVAYNLKDLTWTENSSKNMSLLTTSILESITTLATAGDNLTDVGNVLSGIGQIVTFIKDYKTLTGSFKAGDAATNISVLFEAIFGGLHEFDPQYAQIGTDIINSFVNAITEMATNVRSACSSLASSGVEGFRDNQQAFAAVGRYLIIGLNNGMVSKASVVYKNAAAIARNAANTMRNVSQIRSPSRVFAEIGGYMMLGLAKGIEDIGDEAIDSVVILGDALIAAMQNAMAYADSESYGFMPTITPVMDMSEMTAQSADFRNTLSGFDFQGMTAKANVDGATINNSIQSRDIVNEIKALNDRMAIMDEHLANMQIVLDSGVLVGATSAKMDNQFGIMAMRRGRGN